jgi:hypothetical protein
MWFMIVARLDASSPQWPQYFAWAKLPQLERVVTLDGQLCPAYPFEYADEDWENFAGGGEYLPAFTTAEYARKRLPADGRWQLVGFVIDPPAEPATADGFIFAGYDIIDAIGGISLLSDCGGGFSEAFASDELNVNGLLPSHTRATAVCETLRAKYGDDAHAREAFVVAMWLQA